ncbi:MAG TPA: hypothetical protein DEB13_00975, partial [Candidatus Yanofskybacteria bacterium]|nr:hypothetical protein [Candidatus Yanofskybacteria bacterium]
HPSETALGPAVAGIQALGPARVLAVGLGLRFNCPISYGAMRKWGGGATILLLNLNGFLIQFMQ